ncbi:hypothetical protein FNV43_RR18497 [Rhamnella rubrinervis]|uniref:Uncharacterized protein n=1 Tax=Rhamnella rubrinervis TaxID=2594499 RepID=A0A8K0GVR2_9ROSA|nr:hypothetical protein FNV43_RR18497 [Rhamnella rubrinervis]
MASDRAFAPVLAREQFLLLGAPIFKDDLTTGVRYRDLFDMMVDGCDKCDGSSGSREHSGDCGRDRDRVGGYTRMLRTHIRVGDAAPMAYIEFFDRENELRQSQLPNPQPPQKGPLDPWTKAKLHEQFAPPQEDKNLEI